MDCPSCGHPNPEGAKFCNECATGLAPRAPATSEGERRQLTVMFCDLVGSTALSEGLDPEDFGEVIATYQSACRERVESWSGFAAKTLGDGLLVYFGYPRALEDAPSRAIRAGLEIIRQVPLLNDRFHDRLPFLAENPLAVRVGIHTGLVVIGDITTGGTEEHVALGEALNVASRLQAVAAPNQVVASDATLLLVPRMFQTEDLGTPVLKGVAGPIRVHRVAGTLDTSTHLGIDPHPVGPLVGRDEERDRLLGYWAQAKQAKGGVVLISGEPGIGKSRLLQTLLTRVREEGARKLELRSSPNYTNSAFQPVLEHVHKLLRFDSADGPKDRLAKLEGGVHGMRFASPESVSLLADFLSLPSFEGAEPAISSPQARRRKGMEALTAWFLEDAERTPLCIFWEDLHWADPSSLELISLLFDRIPNRPILAVVTFRPEFQPPWPARSHFKSMVLTRFEREDAEALIAQKSQRHLPAEVVHRIVERTDGIPLFLEELTQTILDSGVLREAEDSFALNAPLPETEIPSTLHDSLQARLDRLGNAKQTAQIASALGREFDLPLLREIAGIDDDALDRQLSTLVGAEILFARVRPGGTRYLFKHALIRDAAYDSLLRSRRQVLHRKVANALQEQGVGGLAVPPEVIAHHLTHAERPEEAIAVWKSAGDQAASRHASVEAIHHFERGLALVREAPEAADRDREELRFLLALGGQLVATRGYGAPGVLDTYERARVLCKRAGDDKHLLRVLGGLFAVFTNHAQVDRARSIAQELLSLAESMDDRKMIQRGHASLGMSFFNMGEHAKARDHMAQGVGLYRREWHRPHAAQDPGVAVGTQAALNWWHCGFPDKALETAQEATALALELEHPYSVAIGLVHEAVVHQYRGETEAVLRKTAEGLELTEKHSILYLSGMALAWKGCAIGETDPAAGIELLSAGSERMKAAGGVAWRPYHKGLIAELLARQGFYDRARARLRPPASADRGAFTPELLRLHGEILALAGYDLKARPYFDRSLALSQVQDAKSLELRAAISLARHCQRQGKPAEARALLAPVYDWFTEGFDTQDLKDAKALLEELG